MEAGRSLKEQEVFYALLEGKHAALDDEANPGEYSYPYFLQRMRYDNKVLVTFIKGYHHASCSANSGN